MTIWPRIPLRVPPPQPQIRPLIESLEAPEIDRLPTEAFFQHPASDPLPVIRGHRAHFVQLFQNLVSNAIKYRSKRPPLIRLSVAQQNGTLRFAVADNGMGIAPQHHEKIFGVFKRLHGKKVPGTGIGLAICQRVVERYGGRIWVESEPDKGATFVFTLPIDGELRKVSHDHDF